MPATTQGINWTHAEVTELEVRVCPVCGITYAGPGRFFDDKKSTKKSWYCPNGHSLSFTKSDAEVLQEKLASEKRNAEFWRSRTKSAEADADHARAQANGYKGALTKVKKRVGNGVCPCCNRTFANLNRHMETKHPTFKKPIA